ncbi:MAG: hypothetical protein FWG45_04320 [Oscillospiraceae bacterium]|nr:hypothetical protein [Oscillospiraceae bacterium]
MNEQNSNFNNFDDFIAATAKSPDNAPNNVEYVPLHERQINRDDEGYATDIWSVREAPPIAAPPPQTFKSLFPGACISWEVIRESVSHGDNVFEKIMGVCMFLAVAAALNPLTLGAVMLMKTDVMNMQRNAGYFAFFIGIILFSLISVIAVNKSFSLIPIGIITVLKIYPFTHAAADSFMIILMMILTYIFYQFSKRAKED